MRAAESDDIEETLLKVGKILVENLLAPAGLQAAQNHQRRIRSDARNRRLYHQNGTEPTIAYLADLIQRRIPFRSDIANPQEAAFAFLYLVACGPATMAAWGLVLDKSAIDRHTQYSVRLFLYGLLPRATSGNGDDRTEHTEPGKTGLSRSQSLEALETENRRLKKLLLDSMLQLAALKERQGTERPR